MPMPNITYIQSYIKDGQTSVIGLKNFYDTLLVTDVDNRNHIFKIPINDFFLKYRHQLEDAIQWYSVADSFIYKPKSLSLDLYGTTEMWLSLLRLNNMRNISEFYEPIIQVYSPGEVKRLINIFFKRDGKVT